MQNYETEKGDYGHCSIGDSSEVVPDCSARQGETWQRNEERNVLKKSKAYTTNTKRVNTVNKKYEIDETEVFEIGSVGKLSLSVKPREKNHCSLMPISSVSL